MLLMFMPDCSRMADRPPHECKLQTGQNLKEKRTLVGNATTVYIMPRT